jgi:aminoglycoside/choline kinase family phosphotransferase
MLPNDHRLQELKQWLKTCLDEKGFVLKPASEDASFRRYFRVWAGEQTYIAMDAPPEKENCKPFVDIAQLLLSHGLNVPQVFQQNLEQGFLLLSDLGNTQYLSKLDAKTANPLYSDALAALLIMQTRVPADGLPAYHADMLKFELSLFVEWFLHKHLKLKLTEQAEQTIADAFNLLVDNAVQQPQIFIHRDYHSRNLMITPDNNPGILDFQGAVLGPITYDLVSLFRDCYIAWPKVQVEQWLQDYHQSLTEKGLVQAPLEQFRRWFDLTGLQRHLKAIGIFCRMLYSQQKPGYMNDIPRTIKYVFEICEQYPELAEFKTLLDRQVKERLSA